MAQTVSYETVTIAITTAVSSSFRIHGRRVMGVLVPAEWTAADISFEVALTGAATTWAKVVNRAGALYKLTGVATAAAELQLISGDANQADVPITGPYNFRVVSTNTASEANVNQDAARTLMVILTDL